jgi:hypothetical protein
MNYNTQGYVLNEYDYRRIKPLKQIVDNSALEFKYFITLDYFRKTDDIASVLKDNEHFRKELRRFFKSDIRMFFFNEKHLKDPSSKFYGSFHRHILMEAVPEKTWKEPTSRMKTFMLELDPEMLFACQWSAPSEKSKVALVKKVVKGFNKTIPNGSKGMCIEQINYLDGLLSYCTKQNKNNVPHEYVIDTMNSDGLDNLWYRHNYGRQQAVFT